MKFGRRTLAVLLALIMTVSLLVPAFAEGEGPAENIPILRIRGEQTTYVRDEDGTSHELYGDGEYKNAIKDECMAEALRAVATGNWDAWGEKAFQIMKPAYDGFKPDEEGNVDPSSWVKFKKTVDEYGYIDSYSVEGSYQYIPDIRVSPMDEADGIKAVVDRIKELTGQDKIIFIGQCVGNAYLMAYLHKYEEPTGYAGVESVLFSTATLNGTPPEDSLYSGNVRFDTEASFRALKNGDSFGIRYVAGGALLQLLYDTLDVVYRSRLGTKLTLQIVNDVYNKVKDPFIAKLVQEYYGRCGGYVSNIVEHYEDYKDYVFPTQEDRDRYAVQIAKFDDYYYNVSLRKEEMIGDMRENGINVSCIAEYGIQSGYYYAGDIVLETSDSLVPVSYASFGATGRAIGDPFPEEYVAEKEAAGLGGYISPDRTVDASTGLLPDTTWFIKNANHQFDSPIMALCTAVVRTPDADVEKLEEQGYLQFMNYTDGSTPLAPAQETDDNDSDAITPAAKTFLGSLLRWFRTLFVFFGQLFKSALR